jgi:hypothetical protein
MTRPGQALAIGPRMLQQDAAATTAPFRAAAGLGEAPNEMVKPVTFAPGLAAGCGLCLIGQ